MFLPSEECSCKTTVDPTDKNPSSLMYAAKILSPNSLSVASFPSQLGDIIPTLTTSDFPIYFFPGGVLCDSSKPAGQHLESFWLVCVS